MEKLVEMQKDAVSLLNEIKRRLSHPYYRYNKGGKIHRKQVAFHRDRAPTRFVLGGNRTGKTECGAMEAVWFALGTHPHRRITGATEGWVVSVSLGVGRDVAQRKVLKYLHPGFIQDIVMRSGSKGSAEHGVIDFIVVKNRFGTTSKIGFKSCDQGREKFQGTGLDWIWFDEEPPYDIYEECLLRTLDRRGVIWGTMTPLKGRTWLYQKIYLNANQGDCSINVHQLSWEDNPFLNQQEIKRMEQNLSSDALESRKYGRFMEGEGMVFTEFTDENIIDPFDIDTSPDSAFQIKFAIDPGLTAPTGAVWVATDGQTYYVLDDYSVSGKQPEEHAAILKRRCAEIGMRPDGWQGKFTAYIDSAAKQKHSGMNESVATLYNNSGFDVDAGVNKAVIDGVFRIKSLLKSADGVRRLFIFRNCRSLIREMRGYTWGNEKPAKGDDHCIDALRYIINTPHVRKKPDNPITKDKSIRRMRNQTEGIWTRN